MTHDPMCPAPLCADACIECDYCLNGCKCDWIAKVRADQIERDAAIVRDFGWSPETDDADIRQVIAELRQ